ncbi:hypothetical protein WME90_01860 [Sorangium sp. So ce375]|uniref:hypothetical protein n=1 Tax=Sorangium sp. So ce375 TaxID=3133306 RepID=UPI003F5BF233
MAAGAAPAITWTPRVAWTDDAGGIRVVILQEGPVVEVASATDAMGAPLWRRVSTDDPSEVRLRKIEGWKAICVASGLEPSQWKQVLRASRRRVDPLNVQYDAFDRPFVYEVVLRDWLARGQRSSRAYHLEKAAERQYCAGQRRRIGHAA